ncbi:ABC transporter substrate-binding protein [Flavobacterium selenitireducens]|uniref:ABC transporter substrate-binding protein n=1 Tax=Flavobacterium selenitireducens TaxID=2722704 RepID=UPI00168A5761|nr:ABC transporter substrate-binding protein [Flavobacterium selenitireducens]MBD3582825.1 ABC transporter substrate-binding protein [Flavobacterium selenitireducens]
MKQFRISFFAIALSLLFIGCKKSETIKKQASDVRNSVKYANGLSIFDYGDYSVVKVSDPWPNANKNYTYVLREKDAKVPDSLASFTTVNVPVKSIIATSTTHIPSLEMLGVENSLIGFPQLNYISSEKVRANIDVKKVREIGQNQSLNTEVIIDLQPDVIIGYGIDNNNPTIDNLEKSGLKVLLNGDWNETTALGKAEWIKLFGALYGLEDKADKIFSDIEKSYNETLALAKSAKTKPTVVAGAMFENKWYLPQGKSWGAELIAQGGGQYMWSDSEGTGSLSLPFETVLEKAKDAEFWIGPGEFTSLTEMQSANAHYAQFKAFQTKNVYSFSSKKGKTGGVIYFELAPNRPDLVLKDIVKILHPELLPNYELFFFEKLN